jgi:hypothetical protein
MVGVGAHLWVYNCLFLPFLPEMGVATKRDKTQKLPLEECYHTFFRDILLLKMTQMAHGL